MGLGDRIKTIRGSLSQKEFATKIGVHISTAQLYETKDNIPKGDVLQRINEEFGVDLNWLLTGKGEPYRETSKKSVVELTQEIGANICAEEKPFLNSPDKGFRYVVSMIKRIFDTKNKWLIGQAIAAVAVIHDLALGKERLEKAEECLEEIKKTLPPDNTEERRALWRKLKETGLIKKDEAA